MKINRCAHCFSAIGHEPSCIVKEWVIIQTINRIKTVEEFQRTGWDKGKFRLWFMCNEPFILKTVHFPMYPLIESLVVGVYEHLVIPVPTEMLEFFSLNEVVKPGEQVTFTFRKTPCMK